LFSRKKKYLLFAGNPGVGKSTLLNCIMNRRSCGKLGENQIFKSGISMGSGMTFELDIKQIDGVIYMDTPGLEDIKMRKQAAKAITEALKRDGEYQIVFVVTLEAGRVRPTDVTTITLVLESAKEITHYGVIFNILGKRVLKKINEENFKMELLTQVSLKSGPNKPVPIPFSLGRYPELDDEDNAIISIPELEDFLSTLPPIKIQSKNVEEISTDNYQALKDKTEEELAFLKENNKAMQKKMEENKEYFDTKLQKILEAEKARLENERSEFKEKYERMMTHMETQLERPEHDLDKRKMKELVENNRKLQQREEDLKSTIVQMEESYKESLEAIMRKQKSRRLCVVM